MSQDKLDALMQMETEKEILMNLECDGVTDRVAVKSKLFCSLLNRPT